MASGVSCITGLSLIWVTGNNMSQSKTAVPLCKLWHWVFHKVWCWALYFSLLYINDMYRSSNQMRFIRFADDTTVFASDSDVNNVHTTVNRELVGVDNWLNANRLSPKVSKTSYMIISNQKNTFDIRIRDSILTKVPPVKLLGVTLDENRTFNDHAKNVTTKISKSVGVMRRLQCQLPADVMVYTILWCIPIWLMCYWHEEDQDVLMLLRLSVLTGEQTNYS